ncbi:hypothetical protein AEB_P3378 [Altererythrobacter sp. B11]|nr:hypothetical protein AEB_P3378 [Altererythrobacter sp. B11]
MERGGIPSAGLQRAFGLRTGPIKIPALRGCDDLSEDAGIVGGAIMRGHGKAGSSA